MQDFHSPFWNLLAVVSWVRWRDHETASCANSGEGSLMHLVRLKMRWPDNGSPSVLELGSRDTSPDPEQLRGAIEAAVDQSAALGEISHAGQRGQLKAYLWDGNGEWRPIQSVNWPDVPMGQSLRGWLQLDQWAPQTDGDISLFNSVASHPPLEVDLRFDRDSVLAIWPPKVAAIRGQEDPPVTAGKPDPGLQEPGVRAFLESLAAQRPSKDVAWKKLKAGGQKIGVSREKFRELHAEVVGDIRPGRRAKNSAA